MNENSIVNPTIWYKKNNDKKENDIRKNVKFIMPAYSRYSGKKKKVLKLLDWVNFKCYQRLIKKKKIWLYALTQSITCDSMDIDNFHSGKTKTTKQQEDWK